MENFEGQKSPLLEILMSYIQDKLSISISNLKETLKIQNLPNGISMILAKYIGLNYSKSANGLIMEKSDIALENQKIKIKMLMSGSAIYWFNPNQLKGRYTLAQGT